VVGVDGVEVESVSESPLSVAGTTIIEFIELDKVVPLPFVAVTVADIVCPASDAVVTYEFPVAPEIFAPPRFH
jgi:hypothetical protein